MKTKVMEVDLPCPVYSSFYGTERRVRSVDHCCGTEGMAGGRADSAVADSSFQRLFEQG